MTPKHAAILGVTAFVLSACGSYHLETAPASEPTPRPTPTAPVSISKPLLVVNEDGSATVALRLKNPNDSTLTLMGVGVSSIDENLPVTTTGMLMPVPAHLTTRVGDAGDAGGFVVPRGVTVGGSYGLVVSLDNGTCAEAEVVAVDRADEHQQIYPLDGSLRGVPVPPAAAERQCDAGEG